MKGRDQTSSRDRAALRARPLAGADRKGARAPGYRAHSRRWHLLGIGAPARARDLGQRRVRSGGGLVLDQIVQWFCTRNCQSADSSGMTRTGRKRKVRCQAEAAECGHSSGNDRTSHFSLATRFRASCELPHVGKSLQLFRPGSPTVPDVSRKGVFVAQFARRNPEPSSECSRECTFGVIADGPCHLHNGSACRNEALMGKTKA
jgi:hypothetical protein